MTWRDGILPAPMLRTAIVAPERHLRRVLVEVADAGVFEPDASERVTDGPFARLAEEARLSRTETTPQLSVDPVEVDELDPERDRARVLGEADLEQRVAAAVRTHRCAVLPGWIPRQQADALQSRLAPHGGAVVELPVLRGLMAPTAHTDSGIGHALRPLVTTYATMPYRDLDPTFFAAFSYMVMFGMMFGDVAHGLAIVVFGIVASRAHADRWRTAHEATPFLIGAGLAATGFGLLYGEAFGPTGLVPTLWIRPLDEPQQFLVAGLVLGSCLLAMTFVLAVINRWREAGPGVALYDASGIAGALLFAGAAAFVAGMSLSESWLRLAGAVLAVLGGILTFVGLLVKAGPGAGGVAQALVEMFDTLLRLGSNVVSFTRLAAFGLTHAVMTTVVWDGTVALWEHSTIVAAGASIVLFTVGNAAAFALGALVGAIQALRLEYYEMFSRLFSEQGRPFEPWHVPIQRSETP